MQLPNRAAMRHGAALVALGIVGVAGISPAHADEDNSREAELESRVKELEGQLDEIRESLRGGYASGYSSELEARIEQLEKATHIEKDGIFHYWKNGLNAQSADKKFKFKFGGRIMNDYVFWKSDDATEEVVGENLNTGTEFRRARLYVSGTIYENVDFKAQYDFAGGEAAFKDVYIALKTALGKLTVGHFYAPFGLEEQTSSKYISTMERGLHNTFVPSRQTGFGLKNQVPDQEWWWGIGMFRSADDFGDDVENGEGEWFYSARFAGRPYVNEEGDQYLHVGASAMMINYPDEEIRFRARPMVHISPRFVDTSTFDADEGTHLGLEAAFVSGPFHCQAEWVSAETEDDDSDVEPKFDAYTLQAGFFLTGETRPYKDSFFDRVKPKTNWDGEGGTGAWELVASLSSIDLNDEGIEGGEMDVLVLGLNWYLNPNTRIMLNWNRIDLDRDDADKVDAVQLRFQIDF